MVKYDGFAQPNEFDAADIEREVVASAAERGGAQPGDNTVSGQSATWRQIYERSLRGEAIPVPYHDVKVTDPDKLARMTRAYQAYRRGEIRRDELPDVRDVFPDDETRLAEMGFRTEPGLSGEAVLVQACSLCHNTRLNQNLSRARFVPDLSALNRAEKDAAIARLQLLADDPRAMPPPRLRLLSRAAREAATKALQQ